MSDKPVDPPSPVAVARALSRITADLPVDINYERASLDEVFKLLSQDPPDVAKARAELDDAMAHAFRGEWREDARAEAWLVAACRFMLQVTD